jgi:hypothetical protein
MTERKSTRTTKADIQPTKHDKGVTLGFEVIAYDNGLISLDGEPMNRDGDQGQGYIAVMSAIAEKLWMLQRASAKRAPAFPDDA